MGAVVPIVGLAVGGGLGAAGVGAGLAVRGGIAAATVASSIRQRKKAKEAAEDAEREAQRQADEADREQRRAQREAKKAQEAALAGAEENTEVHYNVPGARSDAPRLIPYGRCILGGQLVYAWTNEPEDILYQVLVLGEGPIDDLEAVYFNELRFTHTVETIGLGGADAKWEGTGQWYNNATVYFHRGAPGQVANQALVSLSPQWTDDHTGEGIAYLVVGLRGVQASFPDGLPLISACVRGRDDVYDPRDGSTGWTENAALCRAHYLQQVPRGPGFQRAEVNELDLAAAADVCDEEVGLRNGWSDARSVSFSGDTVTAPLGHGLVHGEPVRFITTGALPAPLSTETTYAVAERVDSQRFKIRPWSGKTVITFSGTGTGGHQSVSGGSERRYRVAGAVNLVNNPEDVRRTMADCDAGGEIWSRGQWRLWSGAWVPPTIGICEHFFLGPVNRQVRAGLSERANAVIGRFAWTDVNSNLVDYPARTEQKYVEADGAPHQVDVSLPLVGSPSQAQRLAEIVLRDARLEETIAVTCDLRALPVVAGGVVRFSFSRHDIQDQPYFVQKWTPTVTADGYPAIALTLKKTAPEVYDWDPFTDEKEFSPPPELQTGKPRAATPEGSPPGGSYPAVEFPKDVTITTTTSGATIRWSKTAPPSTETDGTAYTAPVAVNAGETLFARAFRDGLVDSNAMVETYESP